METRTITIMLTDIKGFTSKTASFSRAETQELLAKHRQLVLPVIEKLGGRLVKTIGDAFLAAFNSPTDAVICGVKIQAALRAHNTGKSQAEKIEIRIAINAGEVSIHDDGDIYGDAVNITSRLESIAEAGEVFFTEAVYLAMNKKEVPSSEIGYRQFKGIAEKIKVYRVLRETPIGVNAAEGPTAQADADAKAPQPLPATVPSGKPAGIWRRLVSLLLDVCIFTIAMNMLNLSSCGPRVTTQADDKYSPKEFTAGKVDISRQGITVKGENGETISINQGGIKITDPRHPARNPERSKKLEAPLDDKEKARAPLKMFMWALYCSVLTWRFGATAGMMVMKLKVINAATGTPLGPDKAFLRAFFSLVSLAASMLGYAWALWEKEHRTWHDMIAGSKVTRV